MPGNSEDKLFWYIVASAILIFLKGGFVMIGILWCYFFFIVLPRETKEQKRCEAYRELERHPNKLKKALLKMEDLCGKNIQYYEKWEDTVLWWGRDLDPETREYIRKTPYYDHPRFKKVKLVDGCLAEEDKKYIYYCNKIGKENMDAVEYAIKISKGEVGPDASTMRYWWDKISPLARKIIRTMDCYNNNGRFQTIKNYDEEMKRLKIILPEYREEIKED